MVSTTVDFWFDPGCPFTWRTSRWLTEVTERRSLAVTWRLMSLTILNAGTEMDDERRERFARIAAAGRLLEAVRQEYGNDMLAAAYTALGTRLHDSNQVTDETTFASALADVGLPHRLIEASRAPSVQQAVAESHAAGQAAVGQDSGSPIISVGGGPAYFGPIVVPIPTGEEADRVFDAVALLSQVPAFSELKRTRNPF